MTPEEARALEEIRGCAKAGRVELTTHAAARMRERRISLDDLSVALRRAGTCSASAGGKWRVTGLDRGGEELTAIVALEDGVLVVTVF